MTTIEVVGYLFALLVAVCIFVSLTRRRIPRKLKGKAYVVDGDGLKVQGHNIRLHGMDAPEIDQSYGRLAKSHLWTLAGGKTVTCKPIARDHHGRLVSKCTVGEVDLSREMVRAGFAHAYRRYSTDYVEEEKEARRERRGLWAGYNPLHPEEWRRRGPNE